MTLDEVLNDAMDIIWDESTEHLNLAMTNIRQAKKRLDDATKITSVGLKPVWDANIEASRQLEVALDQLMEFITPMDDDEEEEEPEPKLKKAPKACAKAKKAKK